MTKIVKRRATPEESLVCGEWELWESGDVDRFEYQYDQDVQFVVQSGNAVIFSQHNAPVAIEPGDHVHIGKGVEGVWEISAPIVNRYKYFI